MTTADTDKKEVEVVNKKSDDNKHRPLGSDCPTRKKLDNLIARAPTRAVTLLHSLNCKWA